MSENGRIKASDIPDEVVEQYLYDIKNQPIRNLTKEERITFGGAIILAQSMLPSFRDALAIMRPYMDATASTAHTDVHARVGLSYWFFHAIDLKTRATVLLHEAMHVMNNHFARAESLGLKQKTMNYCGDLEINTTLSLVNGTNLTDLLLPERYGLEKYKTMEYYANFIEAVMKNQESNDGEGEQQEGEGGSDSSGNGSGGDEESSEQGESGNGSESGGGNESGSGSQSDGKSKMSEEDIARKLISGEARIGHNHCDESTEERGQQADEAGIEKSSKVEQNLARQNTMARIVEDMNSRSRSDGTSNAFLELAVKLLSPPKVKWSDIFRRAVSTAYSDAIVGKSHTSFKKVNRRYSQGAIIFPGSVDYMPTAMLGIDTSGSMSNPDFKALLSEIETILKMSTRSKNGIKVFSVDSEVQNIKQVRSTKELDLQGGGGTSMSVAFKYVNNLKKNEVPSIFVLGTDGYLGSDWDSVLEEVKVAKYKPIILVTTAEGFSSVPNELKSYATVIDLSDDSRTA